jgi:hypothetical protein
MNYKLTPMKKYLLAFLLLIYIGINFSIAQQTNQPPKKDCRKDADDDGINDCFDQCANTPKGVRVDSKGCPRDTDGDGIPDYKDKQLITPTECQPSDTNGIGECKKEVLNK